jgi:predicted RNA-binding protein YlqC (UPF0109 family)
MTSPTLTSDEKLLNDVVKGFVDHPDDVRVMTETADDGSDLIKLSVNPEDMGKVIGKSGKIAKSLRLLIRIPAVRSGRRVNLEISES